MSDDSLWEKQAKRWKYVGQPLRPTKQDVARVEKVFSRLDKNKGPLTGVLLGVTPELATANLDMSFIAVDSEKAMIDLVWAGDTDKRKAIVGDWFTLSKYTAPVDFVMGDGCVNAITFEDCNKLFSSISDVLKPGGLLSLRIFQRPYHAENVDDVFNDVKACGNFHIFKWYLAMAVQGYDYEAGVKLADVWNIFNDRYPDKQKLADLTGWSINEIETIDNYKGVQGTYSFARVDEIMDVAEKFNLELMEVYYPTYELAERCPTLLFRR